MVNLLFVKDTEPPISYTRSSALLFFIPADYNGSMKNKTKKRILLASLGALAAGCAVLNEKVYRFIFERDAKPLSFKDEQMPNPYFKRIEQFKKQKLEALEDLDQQPLHRCSASGRHLHATLFPASVPSKRYVLCAHGYRTDGFHEFCAFVPFYLEQGFNVILLDHQAHGASDGHTITFGLEETEDTLDWIHWIVEHFGDECAIVLHGMSMGAAIVMSLAATAPDNVKFIVEDCGYASAKTEFEHTLGMAHLSKALYPWIAALFFTHEHASLSTIQPIEEVAHAKVPMLFIHGMKDTLVPFSMAERLYAACPQPKDQLFVPQADHAQSYYLDPKNYERKIKQFIQKYMS